MAEFIWLATSDIIGTITALNKNILSWFEIISSPELSAEWFTLRLDLVYLVDTLILNWELTVFTLNAVWGSVDLSYPAIFFSCFVKVCITWD